MKTFYFTEKSASNLHLNILPHMVDGDQLVVNYNNKYDKPKTMVFVFSLTEKGHMMITSQNRKYKYEQDYITYQFYNSFSNFREGFKIISSVFVR